MVEIRRKRIDGSFYPRVMRTSVLPRMHDFLHIRSASQVRDSALLSRHALRASSFSIKNCPVLANLHTFLLREFAIVPPSRDRCRRWQAFRMAMLIPAKNVRAWKHRSKHLWTPNR
jgi:hypothetical protein